MLNHAFLAVGLGTVVLRNSGPKPDYGVLAVVFDNVCGMDYWMEGCHAHTDA